MDIFTVFRIAIIGIIVIIMNSVMKGAGKDEYTILVTLAGLVVILMMILPSVMNLFNYIVTMFDL
ncbi:MAG: stage III sporulation protein AC [Oscillospiraceae bacterium]|nr:stage III sporulation protein AC [Oscillospiraceae bacterium]